MGIYCCDGTVNGTNVDCHGSNDPRNDERRKQKQLKNNNKNNYNYEKTTFCSGCHCSNGIVRH